MNHFPTTTTAFTINSSKEIIKIKKKRSTSTSSSSSSCNKIKGPMKLSTDPQSVAARERRHRISDRFKILQSLVPGGSKMDTVSMLEEAIHYVKFLKTQIWLHHNMIMINNNNNNHHHDHPYTASLYDHTHQSTASLYDVLPGDYPYYYSDNSFQTPEITSFDSNPYVKF